MPLPRFLPVTVCSAFVALAFAPTSPAAPVQWRVEDGGNGHYYEWVYLGDGGNTWEFARAAAASRSHAGAAGHLATITSAAEQAFVRGAYPNSPSMYLGGSQARDSAAPDQGWSWITGEPWQYTAWSSTNSPVEPTDGIGFPSPEDNAENYLSLYPGFMQNHGWNDVSGTTVPSSVASYLVEFSVVPEPSAAALSLTAAGLVLLRGTRGTRR